MAGLPHDHGVLITRNYDGDKLLIQVNWATFLVTAELVEHRLDAEAGVQTIVMPKPLSAAGARFVNVPGIHYIRWCAHLILLRVW
jgi:hypothetical protein